MAWCRIADKQLPKTMMETFTDAYIRTQSLCVNDVWILYDVNSPGGKSAGGEVAITDNQRKSIWVRLLGDNIESLYRYAAAPTWLSNCAETGSLISNYI